MFRGSGISFRQKAGRGALMKKTAYTDAAACTGAVIGAGFASGKEIMAFFACYGIHAVWLSVLTSVLMAALMLLCMNSASANTHGENWLSLFDAEPLPGAAAFLLQAITAGAMIAAAGHLISLLWASKLAYPAGALGTMTAAWFMGRRHLKILSWASAVLMLMLLLALMICLAQPVRSSGSLAGRPDASALLKAAFRAAGYAGMNMTLAAGVVCRCGSEKGNGYTAFVFGFLMMMLLLLSSMLYAGRPEWLQAEFPLVALLTQKGRKGYLFSVLLLYLSVLTTLVSVVYAMRTAAEAKTRSRLSRLLLVFVLPAALSRFGFAGIVERFYAPAGLVCLAIVFLPLCLKRHGKGKGFFS